MSEDEFWEFDRRAGRAWEDSENQAMEAARQRDAEERKAAEEQKRRLLIFGRCCEHAIEFHTHHRDGSNCSLCPCRRWKPRRWWNA